MNSFEDILESLDISQTGGEQPVDKKAITLWLPVDKKAKFDDLQAMSKRKFGKKLQDIVILAIDKVRLEKPA